ncbi:hypothetical protein ASF38_14890 [Aeromicrobium sp. Leaf272]|nr:hypothetical protein ASF38_14890 [Aeromicrobium sp. Leaf272]
MRQAGSVQTRRERLLAPPAWWIAVAAFAIAWGWVAFVVAGPPTAVAVAVAVAGVTGALLWSYGSTVLEAGPDGLRVGRAHLTHEHVGAVTALDAAGARTLLGPGADARAWLHVRPYIATAVQVEVRDPADPAPYWVVSTRDPSAIAQALGRPAGPIRPEAGTQGTHQPSTDQASTDQPRTDPR